MARIPTYDSQVAPNALPAVGQSISNSADQFLDSTTKGLDVLGKGLVAAGDAASFILADQQKMENEARVKEAERLYIDKIEVLMRDPKDGYLTKLRKNALDSREGLNKELESINTSSMEGMTNDVQRRLFSNVQNHHWQAAKRQADIHESSQRKEYAVGESENRALTYQKTMVMYAASHGLTNQDNKPVGPYNDAKATMYGEIDKQGQLLGWGEDKIKAKRLEMETIAHRDVILNLVDVQKNGKLAAEYFKKYNDKGEIDTEVAARLSKLVTHAEKDGNELAIYRSLATMKGGFEDKMAALNKAADGDGMINGIKMTPEMYKPLKAQLEHDKGLALDNQNRATTKLMGDAQTWKLDKPTGTFDEWRLQNPSAFQAISDKGNIPALKQFFANGGKEVNAVEAAAERGRLIQIARDDPSAFLAIYRSNSFREVAAVIGANGMNEMQDRADAIIANGGKYKTAFDPQIMKRYLPDNLQEAKGEQEKTHKAWFVGKSDELEKEWMKSNPGKTPATADYADIARRVNTEYVSPGTWTTNTPLYKISPKKIGSEFISPGLYEEMRKQGMQDSQIRDLVKSGIPPQYFSVEMKSRGASEDEIRAAWKLRKDGTK